MCVCPESFASFFFNTKILISSQLQKYWFLLNYKSINFFSKTKLMIKPKNSNSASKISFWPHVEGLSTTSMIGLHVMHYLSTSLKVLDEHERSREECKYIQIFKSWIWELDQVPIWERMNLSAGEKQSRKKSPQRSVSFSHVGHGPWFPSISVSALRSVSSSHIFTALSATKLSTTAPLYSHHSREILRINFLRMLKTIG